MASVYSLEVGDRVAVTMDGRETVLTVWRVGTDRSLADYHSRTVSAHVRPGGYGVTLTDGGMYDGRWRKLGKGEMP